MQELGRKARPELANAIKAADDGDTVSATLALMTRVAPGETAWRTKLGELIDLQNTLNAEATASAEQTQSQARLVGGLLVALAIGLGALIACQRQLSARQGDLRLCALSQTVRALFDLMRMNRVFSLHASRAEAVASFG